MSKTANKWDSVTGIRPTPYGFRAYVKVGSHQRTKRYKRGTAIKTMAAWRDECRVALRKLRPDTPDAGTLAADVESYLRQVRAMPTYAQRDQHLQLWLAALGSTRRRVSVTAADIRTVLQAWRHAGLSAATCNKRRTALMHLWTVLDGKGASNPVRDAKKFRPHDPLPRGQDPHVVDAALKAAPRCRSRACCRVLLWTGMRPVELERAKPEDLNLKGRMLVVRTAKGGRSRMVPLTSQAVAAWREFDAIEAWGQMPQASPLGRWLKDVTGLPMRVYDLRHTYGTALALRDTPLDVIGNLMGHSTLNLTRRYLLAAAEVRALRATSKLARKAVTSAVSATKRRIA